MDDCLLTFLAVAGLFSIGALEFHFKPILLSKSCCAYFIVYIKDSTLMLFTT